MRLFHQLEEKEQQNCLHYCVHLVIDDLISGDLEFETYSEKYKKMEEELTKTVEEAKSLPEDEQFSYIMNSNSCQMVFDLAMDMARSAYYPCEDDLVIDRAGLESIIGDKGEDGEESSEDENDPDMDFKAFPTINSKNKNQLN